MERVLLTAFALVCLGSSACAEWINLPWKAIGANLPIWKPDDFNPEKKYPAIVWYGGAGERPEATWIQKMTGGNDFILVGMGYRQVPDPQFGEPEIADALGMLKALKQTLTKSLSVDPKKIYVGGFSRGALYSALLLDRDRELAGGLVCATGVFDKRQIALKFPKPVPIYIGCGRYDGNYPQALGTVIYFRGAKADTTLEAWPGTKHEYPEEAPEAMRQWLRVQADAQGLEAEAASWIEKRLAELEEISNPVAQWLAYDEFSDLPFVKKFGAVASKTADTKISDLLKNPVVAVENRWRGESRKILVRESRDRLLKTLTAAAAGHAAIAERAAGTWAGELALHDVERTRELLGTAKVITLPGQPKPGHITPKLPPSAPSGNPGRSPFLPPGIDVKPAD